MYIVSMGMNTKFKVDSHFFNAYHFIHLSLWYNCSVGILSGRTPEEYDLWILSGSQGLRKAYVQPIGSSYNIYHELQE